MTFMKTTKSGINRRKPNRKRRVFLISSKRYHLQSIMLGELKNLYSL